MFRAVWAIVLFMLVVSAAHADTLVLNDGRRLKGEVTLSGSEYTVQMRLGKAIVSESDVSQWIKGDETTSSSTTPPADPPKAPADNSPPPPTTPPTQSKPADTPKKAPKKTGTSSRKKNKNSQKGSSSRDTGRVEQRSVAFAVGPDLLLTERSAVQGAFSITLEAIDGTTMEAKLVRSDAGSNLALLRIEDMKLNFMPVADSFEGGRINCPILKAGTFQPTVRLIGGSADKPAENWSVRLESEAGLTGAPLIADGKIVGMILPKKPMEEEPAAVTPKQLKMFLGDDIKEKGQATDATVIVFHVVALHK